MEYLMLIRYGEQYRERVERASEAELKSIVDEYMAIMETPGVKGGAQVQPPETARTVRVDGSGEALAAEGPSATAEETLGGYYVLEADGLETAQEIAARVPAARMGGLVEVRPLVER